MSYPLRFHRIAVRKPWAGSRLKGMFPEAEDGLPAGTGESVELADLLGQRSVVANGEWRGRDVHELMEGHRRELLGELADMHDLPDFPLAVKLIDTAQPLSIQDHPHDEREDGRLTRRGKSECWIVLAADEGAFIYQGLKEGVSPAEFETSLEDGSAPELLNRRHVRPGDFLYNEAGVVHAIGGGLTLLEIQQNCPTTFRLYDFPRAEDRELQVRAGLEAARFEIAPAPILPTDNEDVLLAPDGPFGVRSIRVASAFRETKDWPGFTVITCLDGACEISAFRRDQLEPVRMKAGDTVLFPADFTQFEVYPDSAVWLIQSWARE